MIRRAVVAGLTGLGLIGGTAAIVYNKNGSETVKIKDPKTGQVRSVSIAGATGAQYSCPSGTRAKLEPYDIEAGRIKLTLEKVRAQERAILRQYPSHRAPHAVVVRFKALGRRDSQLVSAFNTEVDRRNAILDQDCTAQ
jgi:hypothetical protein